MDARKEFSHLDANGCELIKLTGTRISADNDSTVVTLWDTEQYQPYLDPSPPYYRDYVKAVIHLADGHSIVHTRVLPEAVRSEMIIDF